jgi:hypothetical protein
VSKLIALIKEAVSTSETSVNFYETTRRNEPEETPLQPVSVTKIKWLVLLKRSIVLHSVNILCQYSAELVQVRSGQYV